MSESAIRLPPGSLHGWTRTWQNRAALMSAEAREWMFRTDENAKEIAGVYQETAAIQYERAFNLLCVLLHHSDTNK